MKQLTEVLRDHEKICPLLHRSLNFGLMPRHDALSGPLPRWGLLLRALKCCWNAFRIQHLPFIMLWERGEWTLQNCGLHLMHTNASWNLPDINKPFLWPKHEQVTISWESLWLVPCVPDFFCVLRTQQGIWNSTEARIQIFFTSIYF